jgi:hypothetical protein
MKVRPVLIGGACALASLVPASALARKPAAAKAAPTYYLALGDSLSQGAQPNKAGHTVPTDQGYANFLYAAERTKIKNLRLEDLGCLGETTGTMQHGGKCRYTSGSQLRAALRFINRHKIAFITIDIGANNVYKCAHGGTINGTCLSNGIAGIKTDVPKIAAALRKAAGAKTPIVGMTYYDPFLADYLSSDQSTQKLAAASVPLGKSVNDTLMSAFTAQHVKVADVATAFDTYVPFTTTAPLAGHGTVPLAVAKICTLTWMCAAAPRGPNIHANVAGYHAIEKVFAAEL